MVSGSDKFTLWDGRAENPAPGPNFDQWISLYRQHLETMGFERGVIVHTILYGSDNAITIKAVRQLGASFRGVGLLLDGAPDSALDAFVDCNMSAVRLNYVHGGVLSWDGAKAMMPALAERGLHIQMLMHVDQHIDQLAADIRACPVPIVVDHIGWPSAGLDPNGEGIDTLCALLSEGHIWVKLSALYRLCPAPFTQADNIVSRLISANPQHCLWGSDWPYLMLNGAKSPNAADLLNALDAVATDTERHAILVDNPEALFGF